MARHSAPRGPIKAKSTASPLSSDTLVYAKRCGAHSSQTGKPCGQWAIRGGTVCRTHGGRAPQVKAAAERRLADLRPAAILYLDWLLNQKAFPSAGLGAAKDVLDRNDGRPAETVAMHVSGSLTLEQRIAAARERLRDRELPAGDTPCG